MFFLSWEKLEQMETKCIFPFNKKEDLTEGYALHKMKFLQSLEDSVFECSERELSVLWEVGSM